MDNKFLKQFKGFSQLNYEERLNKLLDLGFISLKDKAHLKSGLISKNKQKQIALSESLIENTLGYFHLPLGLAVNFIINNKPYVLPLAVEESSIIAAASKTARWVCSEGEITTQVLSTLSTGQIQFPKVKDFKLLKACIEKNFSDWKEKTNKEVLASMVKRGGGLKNWELRSLKKTQWRCDGGFTCVYRYCRGYGGQHHQSGL